MHILENLNLNKINLSKNLFYLNYGFQIYVEYKLTILFLFCKSKDDMKIFGTVLY